jgi:hypothetical protein
MAIDEFCDRAKQIGNAKKKLAVGQALNLGALSVTR